MSDQGSETPPPEGPEDPQSHLRIIPPDPVPDAGDTDVPAAAQGSPLPGPAGGPRVRVFADSDDPALMPLPAMGPGSGGSRIGPSDEVGSADSAGESGAGEAADDAEALYATGDDEAAAEHPPQDDEPDGEETTVEHSRGAEEATTPDHRPEDGDEETTVDHPAEVDEGTTLEQPLATEGLEGGVSSGVRLDRSDTGDIIKVTADQIPRDAEDEPAVAAEATAGPRESADVGVPSAAVPAQQGQRPSAMVKVATGLGFGAVALVVILLGRPAFAVLVGVLVVWGAIEFYSALYQSSAQAEQAGAGTAVAELTRRPAAVVAVVAVGAMVVTTYFYGIEATGAMACAALVAALLWFVPEVEAAAAPRDATLSVLGIVHVGVAGTFAMLIMRLDHGFALLLAVVILVVVSDVAAYAWGSNLGHTPFFNSVSPNKSLEGFLGAVATTIGAALVITGLHGWLYPSVPVLASWGQMFAVAVLVAVAAAAGDLAESLFKRELGIKDVASFLPGHGGMLDRLDGMLFALPVAYVFFVAVGVADVG